MVHWFFATLAVFLTLGDYNAMGSQDNAIYPPGFVNPLVAKDPLYYRDAPEVLGDLASGEFDALYIQYHGCVWSEYGTNDSENGNACGVEGNGDENWYTGMTQCFRSNVAYSLYGVKSGQQVHNRNPCSKHHYMNSFFTTDGFDSFLEDLGMTDADDYGATTECQNYDDDGNDDGDDYNYVQVDHGEQIFGDSYSTTTGCSAEGRFIQSTFQGKYCDGNHLVGYSNIYPNMNNDLEALGCYQIHGAQQQGNNNNNQDEDEDENQSIAVLLLTDSAACSYSLYPDTCPDPHNMKAKRDVQLYYAARAYQEKRGIERNFIAGSVFLVFALIFLVQSCRIQRRIAKRKPSQPIVSKKYTKALENLKKRTQSMKERFRTSRKPEVPKFRDFSEYQNNAEQQGTVSDMVSEADYSEYSYEETGMVINDTFEETDIVTNGNSSQPRKARFGGKLNRLMKENAEF